MPSARNRRRAVFQFAHNHSQLKVNSYVKYVPTIALENSRCSGYILILDKGGAVAAGANDYMQKPLALAQFNKHLESNLRRLLPN